MKRAKRDPNKEWIATARLTTETEVIVKGATEEDARAAFAKGDYEDAGGIGETLDWQLIGDLAENR